MFWNETYGEPGNDEGYSIVECNDGGPAVVGHVESFWSGQDLWLVRTDADGNVLWDQLLGGGGSDFGRSIVLSDAGGFAIVSITKNLGTADWDVWLLRFPSDAPAFSLPMPVPWGPLQWWLHLC
ncbi:MAG: hypothetical protein ACE5H4_13235 [Candidatus Thorarchaeota archaeon]